ncbi:MAG: tetratricopeptide repeat protein, partial [Rhodospirillaceae bacterium]|nr:tetratricopeptide repeat protein [Rhodospirillaceae bacterium]
RAAELAPDEPYYQYVIGIALNSTGERAAAVQRLREVHARFPGHRDTVVALATIHRDGGEVDEARMYAQRLLEMSPADPSARALIEELNSGAAP